MAPGETVEIVVRPDVMVVVVGATAVALGTLDIRVIPATPVVLKDPGDLAPRPVPLVLLAVLAARGVAAAVTVVTTDAVVIGAMVVVVVETAVRVAVMAAVVTGAMAVEAMVEAVVIGETAATVVKTVATADGASGSRPDHDTSR